MSVRDLAVNEDGRLQLVFFGRELGAGLLHPAVQAAVMDGRLHPGARQASRLAEGQPGG